MVYLTVKGVLFLIKREPYIGMPIILGEYDDMQPAAMPAAEAIHHSRDCDRCSSNTNNGNIDRNSIDNLPVAMAYVPMQRWERVYEPERGLKEGTMFPELNLPFKGYQGGMGR